ncbi:YczE/YyaS/YitT family protein [Ectobacillus ponti]|uniref:YitT family protein n=1 Tax=Ectobacillus ponti TaxID=2961894 RepID=A0AA42BPT6_9BACI|nr:hypothetical protein [Ectobacillus ponti]MCP8969520.1 hypothetical protein [Ectobacillus ponti]
MLQKVIYYALGMFIACTGVSIVIRSNIGAGPWDAFYIEAAEKAGLSLGTCVIVGQILFMLLNSALLKKRPVFESAITILLWGFILDLCNKGLLKHAVFAGLPLMSRWLLFLLGVVLIGIGVGLYLQSKFPAMPYDGTMLAIGQCFGLKLGVSRTILEGTGLLLASMIGGPVGFGSLVFVCFLGTFIGMCSRGMERLLVRA